MSKKFSKIAKLSAPEIRLTKPHDFDISHEEEYKGFKVTLPDEGRFKRDGIYIVQIMDKLLNYLMWLCARHNEVLIIRYDLYLTDSKIELQDLNTDLFKKLRKVKNPDAKELIFQDIQYVWARELGTHEANMGIHYHFTCGFRMPNRLQMKQITDKYQEIATKVLENKTKVTLSDELKPYIKVNGYFLLKRDMLPKKKAEQQAKDMVQQISGGEGYKYLRSDIIETRKKNTGKPIGGVLEECVYALSYLAKYVTKDYMRKGLKVYGSSSFRDKSNMLPTRKDQIDEFTVKIEKLFSEYNTKQE
jgi:hypothetical protein